MILLSINEWSIYEKILSPKGIALLLENICNKYNYAFMVIVITPIHDKR